MAKEKFDPLKLLEQVLENDFDLTVFQQIDETPFPEAPNFMDFIIGREFCDATILPWQVEAGMHLFSEYCPVCSNPKYTRDLFNEPLEEIRDNVQFLHHGVCLKCKQNRLQLFTMGENHPTKPSLKSEFIGCVGQRSGKCHAASNLILTPMGAVRIDSLKPGDTVYGYESDGSIKPCSVVAVVDQGDQPVLDIYRYGEKLFSVTPNHKFLCRTEDQYDRHGNVYIPPQHEKTIEEILTKKSLKLRRTLVDIPGGDTAEPHAYALGALLGDGCSRQGTRNCISISSEIPEIPKKVATILGAVAEKNYTNNYTWYLYGTKHSKNADFDLRCNHYAEWLQDKYAHEKTVDLEVVKNWNTRSRMEFLAGLFDTDGSVYLAKNKYGEKSSLVLNYTSQAKSIVDAINWILLSHFQVQMAVNIDCREKYKNGPCYSMVLKDNFHCSRILLALKNHMVHPARKWKPEYENLRVRNSNPSYLKVNSDGVTRIDKTYDIQVDNETHLYVMANQGAITHNSKLVAMASAYQLHKWLKIPNPIEYYDLPKMEIVVGTYSALSAGQAEDNLWIPFKGLYDASPWFKKYNDFLKGEQKRLSIPIVDVKDTYLYYLHKRIMMEFTGADDRKKRGRTRWFGAIDEIAFFNTDKKASKVLDADKNYRALNNSLSTIRKKAIDRIRRTGEYNVMQPIMYNVSSPKNVQDKIWTLTKSAPNNPWAYAIHRATWEANPDFTEADCRNINQGLSEIDFWCDYGAIPPFSDSPYISDSRHMLKLCAERPKLLTAKRDIFVDGMGDRYLMLKAEITKPDKLVPRLMSLDCGYNNNAFAITIFHWDSFNKKPILDFAVNLYPDQNVKLYINFPAIFDNFVLPVVKNFRIMHVFYDRWQSLEQIQRLRGPALKIDAQAHSLNYEKDFLPFKQSLSSGTMGLPMCTNNIDDMKDTANPIYALKEDPIGLLIWQCLTVREVGRKVMKPLDGDDDLFRAFVLGGSRFLDEKIRKKYESYSSVLAGQSAATIGRTYSMGQTVRTTANAGRVTTGAVVGSVRSFGRKK